MVVWSGSWVESKPHDEVTNSQNGGDEKGGIRREASQVTRALERTGAVRGESHGLLTARMCGHGRERWWDHGNVLDRARAHNLRGRYRTAQNPARTNAVGGPQGPIWVHPGALARGSTVWVTGDVWSCPSMRHLHHLVAQGKVTMVTIHRRRPHGYWVRIWTRRTRTGGLSLPERLEEEPSLKASRALIPKSLKKKPRSDGDSDDLVEVWS